MTTVFGIKNCDTVKKALRWLEKHQIEHHFHDFRVEPVPASTLEQWLNIVGKERLVNTRSTTWRNLPEEDKGELTPARTIHLLQANPTLMKRPVLVHANGIDVGFSESAYAALFSAE
ncbi:MAG: arsenate reductase [Idiomarina sp.]|nr:arsenate reductase [Idiomarina sp.]